MPMKKYSAGIILLLLVLSVTFFREQRSRFGHQKLAKTIPSEATAAGLDPAAVAAISLSETPPLGDFPYLSICKDGVSFCQGTDPIVLRGVNIPNLIFADSTLYYGALDLFKQDVEITKEWGVNFVVVSYDPARAANFEYAEKIVEAVEHTRDLGMHVGLMQHHSKVDLDSTQVIHLPIRDEGSDTLNTDVRRRWLDLLSHPGFAERLSRAVDIFGIFSEPSRISWKQWRPRAEKACLDIREVVKRDAICNISGIRWGWDVRGVAADPFQIPSVAAEVHNYYGHEFFVDRDRNWERLLGNVPILVGEFGYTDPPNYIQELLSDMRANDISWAAWPGGPILWSEVPHLDDILIEELTR
jgi:hypothetical protein